MSLVAWSPTTGKRDCLIISLDCGFLGGPVKFHLFGHIFSDVDFVKLGYDGLSAEEQNSADKLSACFISLN